MSHVFRKYIAALLAAILLAAVIPLAPWAQDSLPDGDSPLSIEIATDKKSYTLLSTITYSVTITNTSDAAVRNVSAEALFGSDIAPVEGSQLTAEKGSLAPGESLQLRFQARPRTLKKLDVLLYPVRLICSLFASPALDVMDNHFDDGRAYTQASARPNLFSLFDVTYAAAATIRVWYGWPDTDDFSGVLTNDFFEGCEEGNIAVESGTAYTLLLSKARNLTAGIQAGGDLQISTIRHNAAWVFALEEAGDGGFAIRSLAAGLVIAPASDEENAPLRLEAYTGAAHQLWTKRIDRDGQYCIVNRGSGKAIDISGDALVQREPNERASQAWELMPIDAQALARPNLPAPDSPANWAENAIRYPEEGKPAPAGPIYVQWHQDPAVGEVEYYELVFDEKEPVAVLPTGARIMGYRWYSTEAADHTVQIAAVLTNGERITTQAKSFTVSKKGIGWGTLHRIEDMNLAWYYNWYTTPCAGLPSHLRFEPQVWGDMPELGLDGLWERGYRSVMAFNEPDSATQANMTAARAASLWPQFMATGLRLGSPAMSNNAAAATGWLAPFMEAIDGNVDYMIMHCYTSGTDDNAVLKMIDDNWAKYRKPIWIKEFAVASFGPNSPWGAGRGDPAAVAAFMERLLPELDKRPYVERYAWYPFGTDDSYGGASALFDYGTGELTALGKVYREF